MEQRESYESIYHKLLTYRARLRDQLMVDIFNAKNLRGTTLDEVGEYYGFDFVSGRFPCWSTILSTA